MWFLQRRIRSVGPFFKGGGIQYSFLWVHNDSLLKVFFFDSLFSMFSVSNWTLLKIA